MDSYLSEEHILYAQAYLSLNPKCRKIIQFIWHKDKQYKGMAFPRIANIAKFAGCSDRHVTRFLRGDSGKFFLKEIVTRFEPKMNNRQTTNLYILNDSFKIALAWLEMYGFLMSPKKKTRRIILSMEKQKKCHPHTPQKCQSSSKESLIKDSDTYKKPVFFILKEMPLDQACKEYLSAHFSEKIVRESLLSLRYAYRKNKINKNFEAYVIGTARKMKRSAI